MSLVRPDEIRLPIEGDHYVVVKAELNYGETIAMYAQMRRADGEGVDPLQVGSALVAAYLLDWSLTDNDGRILAVRQQPPDVVAAALANLPYDEGQAVVTAIRAHDDAITAAREEKNAGLLRPRPESARDCTPLSLALRVGSGTGSRRV